MIAVISVAAVAVINVAAVAVVNVAAVTMINVAAVTSINDAAVALMTDRLSTRVDFMKENQNTYFIGYVGKELFCEKNQYCSPSASYLSLG